MFELLIILRKKQYVPESFMKRLWVEFNYEEFIREFGRFRTIRVVEINGDGIWIIFNEIISDFATKGSKET